MTKCILMLGCLSQTGPGSSVQCASQGHAIEVHPSVVICFVGSLYPTYIKPKSML